MDFYVFSEGKEMAQIAYDAKHVPCRLCRLPWRSWRAWITKTCSGSKC